MSLGLTRVERDMIDSSSDDSPLIEEVAIKLQGLGIQLDHAGHAQAAQVAFMAAADLELMLPKLQQCWGGPLNGQEGRQRAFLALLSALAPIAVIETGTFRGITTEWIATHYSGPIWTCEIEPRFYYQARKKLARFSSLSCDLRDSRAFLREILPKIPSGPALFYLDAHWKEDMPLKEEIELILEGRMSAVIVVDDFQVPFDDGYGWDDYGPGRRVNLELLACLRDTAARIFFPTLASEAETGAKRGSCVIAQGNDVIETIARSSHYRGADWRDWRLVELGHGKSALEEQVQAYQNQRAGLERDLAAASQERESVEQEKSALAEQVRTLQLAHVEQMGVFQRKEEKLQSELFAASRERKNAEEQLKVARAYMGIVCQTKTEAV